jgi:hypothetical protein
MKAHRFAKITLITSTAVVLLSACANYRTSTPIATPTPEIGTQPPDVHVLQKALIVGLAKDSFSVQQAKDILSEFAPPTFDVTGDPKKRLQVLISRTVDPAILTSMGEKIPH